MSDFNDKAETKIFGHLVIKDPDTGQVLVNKTYRNQPPVKKGKENVNKSNK